MEWKTGVKWGVFRVKKKAYKKKEQKINVACPARK